MTHFLKNTVAETNRALNGMLEHWYQVCQILNFWHLTHQTPKTNPHQMCQLSAKYFWHLLYNTILSMVRYNHIFYFFFLYFLINFLSTLVKYLYFSLLQPLILSPSYSLSLSLSLSLLHTAPHPLTIKFILSPL